MNDTRQELDNRLLIEARRRAEGRNFRRVLMLGVAALVAGWVGLQGGPDAPIALAAAAALVAVIIFLIVRGHDPR